MATDAGRAVVLRLVVPDTVGMEVEVVWVVVISMKNVPGVCMVSLVLFITWKPTRIAYRKLSASRCWHLGRMTI